MNKLSIYEIQQTIQTIRKTFGATPLAIYFEYTEETYNEIRRKTTELGIKLKDNLSATSFVIENDGVKIFFKKRTKLVNGSELEFNREG